MFATTISNSDFQHVPFQDDFDELDMDNIDDIADVGDADAVLQPRGDTPPRRSDSAMREDPFEEEDGYGEHVLYVY